MSTGPHIILHVGTHKTGTSSVQKTLSRNRDVLSARGIAFFQDPVFNPNNHYIFHHAVTPVLDDHFHTPWFVGRRGLSQGEIRDILRDELLASTASHIVVSAEDLSILPTTGVDELRTFLLDEVGAREVTVVCVLRDPLNYLQSSIQQYTKAGLTSIDDILENKFTNYRYQSCPDFRGGAANILLQIYFPVVERYVEVFGRDACTFLRFEDVIADGIAGAVLRAGMDEPVEVEELRSNEGISVEAAVLLGCYNTMNGRYDVPGQVAPRNFELSRLLQRVSGRKARFPIRMSEEERAAVDRAIASINNTVGFPIMEPLRTEELDRDADDLFHFERESLESLISSLDVVVTPNDPDVELTRRYRDAALQIAKSHPEAAYLLMRRAAELKPDGNVIRRKLVELERAAATSRRQAARTGPSAAAGGPADTSTPTS